jgi:starch phosphorylase
MPVSATAVSDAWRHASSTAARRLALPVTGYGLRYEYGMFHQHIDNGYQIEDPDHWMRDGHPWEVERPEYTQKVRFGGRTEHFLDARGRPHARWVDTEDVYAVPYDVPVSGYDNHIVNTLRLWSASATDEFNLKDFNAGDYADSVASKNQAENITMVLYPNDASENGKELRLRQQYFLTSASLQDAFRQYEGRPLLEFADHNVFQLNDTHPSIAVAEMMRILLDDPDKRLEWDEAWSITTRCMAYTNHTLLPEALERWPVSAVQEPAAASSGDHLRDQCAVPRIGAPTLARGQCACPAHVADRRER